MVNQDTELDGRPFATYSIGGAEIVVRATIDDLSWALMHLGQYLPGRYADRTFRAYILSVERHPDEPEGLITVLVES